MAERDRVALILGGAKCVYEDINAALDIGEFDFVIAVNDIGRDWLGNIDAWISLHANRLETWHKERRDKGGSVVRTLVTHDQHREPTPRILRVPYLLKGQTKSGSSGLFAVKYVFEDMKIEKCVLAGMPMTKDGAHYFSPETPWNAFNSHREGWTEVKSKIAHRVRSMSGWTREQFGAPTREWLGQ